MTTFLCASSSAGSQASLRRNTHHTVRLGPRPPPFRAALLGAARPAPSARAASPACLVPGARALQSSWRCCVASCTFGNVPAPRPADFHPVCPLVAQLKPNQPRWHLNCRATCFVSASANCSSSRVRTASSWAPRAPRARACGRHPHVAKLPPGSLVLPVRRTRRPEARRAGDYQEVREVPERRDHPGCVTWPRFLPAPRRCNRWYTGSGGPVRATEHTRGCSGSARVQPARLARRSLAATLLHSAGALAVAVRHVG
jgi:hypothetical protein